MNNQPSSASSSKNLLILAAVIIAVLIGVIIYLFNNKQELTTENQEVKTELDETIQLKEELELQYEEALADLESLRGENEALNQLPEIKHEEVKAKLLKFSEKYDNMSEFKEFAIAFAKTQDTRVKTDEIPEIKKVISETKSMSIAEFSAMMNEIQYNKKGN